MHRSLEGPRFELQEESVLFLFLTRLAARYSVEIDLRITRRD